MSASLNTYLSLSLNHFKSNRVVLTEPIMACKYRNETLILFIDENGEMKSIKAALFCLFLPLIYNP